MDVKEPLVQYQAQMGPLEYLQWERAADSKHEYAEGIVISMAGASPVHNLILSNLIINVGSFLKNKSCRIYPSDLRIAAEASDSYFYPDATIICGNMEFSDENRDTAKNPVVIFEILSPDTENYDLGKKFLYYMQIPSLQQYITINSSFRQVRSGKRRPDDAWKFRELLEPEEKLMIEPIELELSLQDIYEGISLSRPLSRRKS